MNTPSTNNVPPPFPPNQLPEESLDLKKLLFRFLRNWYWLVLGLAVGFTIAYLQLRYSTTIYNVTSTVFISGKDQGTFSQEELIAELSGGRSRSNVANELEILSSSNLMRTVVDSLQLNVQYFQEGRIKDTELYRDSPLQLVVADSSRLPAYRNIRLLAMDQRDFKVITNAQDSLPGSFGRTTEIAGLPLTIFNRGEVQPGATYRIQLRPPDGLARSYANKLQLRQENYSDVIRMSMVDPVPDKVTDIMRVLIQVYNQRTLREKTEAGQNTLSFVDERLRFITDELYAVERQVEGMKERTGMGVDLTDRASSFLGQLNTLDQAKGELQLQKQLLQKIKAYVEAEDYRILPVSGEILDGSVGGLVQEYNQVLFERENLLESATAENPAVATYVEQLNYLEENILLAIRTKEETIEVRLAAIEQQIAPLEQQIARVPSSERQLLQIMRQQQIKEQLFLFLLEKREETALGIAAQTANASMLDQPVRTGAVSPNRRRTYILYCLLGLALPAGILFLLYYLDNKVRSREDLEEISSTPFLGAIVQSKKPQSIVVSRGSRSSIAELFRMLRTNLSYNAAGEEGRVILVTSSVSGEGKTFVSINLGASLALSGKKVLLLGLDLRKPKLSQYLTGSKAPRGVTNLLVGETDDSSELIQAVEGYDNLHFLDCGPLPPNPAELLMTKRMQELLDTFRQEYDHIIIDLPPVGLVTDALLLEEEGDQTIAVTRFGFTIKPHVKMLDELYQKRKLPKMGIVLNGVKQGRSYGYGYGYGYGGGYGYGYGYYSDDKKKAWWKFW